MFDSKGGEFEGPQTNPIHNKLKNQFKKFQVVLNEGELEQG
jgi:hypothetical protein